MKPKACLLLSLTGGKCELGGRSRALIGRGKRGPWARSTQRSLPQRDSTVREVASCCVFGVNPAARRGAVGRSRVVHLAVAVGTWWHLHKPSWWGRCRG